MAGVVCWVQDEDFILFPFLSQNREVLPSAPRFDSNCITPGTEFMARLHEHLKYFVHKKLSTDPSWQKVQIILSGQDVSCDTL